MTRRLAVLFACDFVSCDRQETLTNTSDVAEVTRPDGWVEIGCYRGHDRRGRHLTFDGLYFCGVNHAARWFAAVIDPDEPEAVEHVRDSEAVA